MSEYSDNIRSWAADTRYAGILEDASGIGEVGLAGPEAGRRLAARFTIRVDAGRVAAVRYQVFGCGFSMAACAAAADLASGRPLERVASIDAGRVAQHLGGLPPERSYCGDLAADALLAAVQSAVNGRALAVTRDAEPEHAPRVTADHPVYRALVATPAPDGVAAEDRHLFACLLSMALTESSSPPAALGLSGGECDDLLTTLFPQAVQASLAAPPAEPLELPAVNRDVRGLLLGYAMRGGGPYAIWLAKILAARAAHPGHLWTAMGLFERPELSAAIRRHLPALAAANDQNMRWKRFLYKQVCDLNGGTLCKTPSCGECSDYVLCFVTEDD